MGRTMATNTGDSPGYQSQSLEPRNSPSEEVRGHWAPTGAEPMERWMHGWTVASRNSLESNWYNVCMYVCRYARKYVRIYMHYVGHMCECRYADVSYNS